MTTNRPLRVFLCHSSNDKPAVRELYRKLRTEPWIEPWLDEEELFPGMDWNLEIEKAIEATDVILVCLSNSSITKEGYVNREIRIALDYADYKPEGTLFIIPVRLEECEPPRRLRMWQYADYFEGQRERGFERLLVSLRKCAASLDIYLEKRLSQKEKADIIDRLEELISPNQEIARPNNIDYKILRNKITLSNGMEFMRVSAGKFLIGSDNHSDDEKPQHVVDIPYDYWMARFPVTNEQYNMYVKSKEIEHPVFAWQKRKDHPITNILWTDPVDYCVWLNSKFRVELPLGLSFRLPTEMEWEKAARGIDGREYPWGDQFDLKKCNVYELGIGSTTPVDMFSPLSDSPYGCSDMAGNTWEQVHFSLKAYPYDYYDGYEDKEKNLHFAHHISYRGGAYDDFKERARCSSRLHVFILPGLRDLASFRICVAPSLPK